MYFRNTKVRIKFKDGISEPVYINRGVRQGCRPLTGIQYIH